MTVLYIPIRVVQFQLLPVIEMQIICNKDNLKDKATIARFVYSNFSKRAKVNKIYSQRNKAICQNTFATFFDKK